MDKTKLLSLTLSQDIGDNTKDDDAEVSSITGSSVTPHLTTRHITPQMFSDSAATSRTLSRMSQDGETVYPNTESVSQLVTKVMRRVRRITLCDPADTVTDDDGNSSPEAENCETELKRSLSCPNITLTENVTVGKIGKPSPNKNKLRFSSGTQTDASFNFQPYETLFPFALPLPGGSSNGKPLPPPQQLLESYIDMTSSNNNAKDLKSQIQMLRSQVRYYLLCVKIYNNVNYESYYSQHTNDF